MPTLRKIRAEYWNGLEADSGVLTTYIADLLPGSFWERGVDGTGSSLIQTPQGGQFAKDVQFRDIIHWVDPVAGTFIERITGIDREDSAADQVSNVHTRPLIMDLADVGLVFDDSTGLRKYNLGKILLTPTSHIANQILVPLVTMGQSYWAVGTIDFTDEVEIDVNELTPLGYMRALEAATGGEFQIRHNGTANVLMDLLSSIGNGSGTPRLSITRGNLTFLRESLRQQNFVTVVTPVRGTRPEGVTPDSIDQFVARVTAVGASTIDIEDPDLPGVNLIVFDDQFGGAGIADWPNWRAIRPDTGALVEITDTSVVNQRLTIVVTGFSVDDIVEFRRDAPGNRVVEVANVTNLADFDRRAKRLNSTSTGGRNYAGNGIFADWTDQTEFRMVNCKKDSTALSGGETSINLTDLPASQVIPDGALLFMMNGTSDQKPGIVDGEQTAAGDGTITLTVLALPFSGGTNTFHCRLYLDGGGGPSVSPAQMPDVWEAYQADALTTPPANSNHWPVFFSRNPEALNTLSLQTMGAFTFTTGVGYNSGSGIVQRITLDGATSGDKFRVGDIIYDTTEAGGVVNFIVASPATANGSGEVTLELYQLNPFGGPSYADNANLDVGRPALPKPLHDPTHWLYFWSGGCGVAASECGMISPAIQVRLQAGWILRGLARFTMVNRDDAGMETDAEARVQIWDDAGVNQGETTASDAITVPASGETETTLTIDHTPLATDGFRVAFRPHTALDGESAGAGGHGMLLTALLDISLSYTPEGHDLLETGYSAANPDFRAAVLDLERLGSLPKVFTLRADDIAYLDSFIIADEKITLGGDVRMVSQNLGIDLTARVIRMKKLPADPQILELTVDTDPLRITQTT